MPVPVGPGVLYPVPDEVAPPTRSYPLTYDFANDGTGRVISREPAGRYSTGENPAARGAPVFSLRPAKTMREPGTYGEI